MQHKIVGPLVVGGVVALFSLAVVLLFAGGLGQATAQEGDTTWTSSAEEPAGTPPESAAAWTSSAEAPAGTPLESFSPADSLSPVNQNEPETAPDALVSWRVTGAAFKPRENDVNFSINSNGSCTYATSGDGSTVWNFAPDLPQGAVVDTLRMYFYDTSVSNSSAWLTVYDLYGTIVEEWNVSSSGNGGNSFNDSATINHTIDYSVYSYLINWRPVGTGSTLQLCGFRVFYEPPPFGLRYLPTVRSEP